MLKLSKKSCPILLRRIPDFVAALSLLPLGKILKLGSITVLTSATVVLSSNAAHAQSADDYIERGFEKFKSGDYQGALYEMNKAVETNPKYHLPYQNRASVKGVLGDTAGACVDFQKAIDLDTCDYCEKMLKELRQEGLCQIVFKTNTDHSVATQKAAQVYNEGNAKMKLGDYQGAIADYSKALEINPQFDLAYGNRAKSKYHLEDYQGAIDDYTKAIQIKPLDANSYSHRGTMKYLLLDSQGALADLNKAIAIDPQNAAAYTNRAQVHLGSESLGAACDDYKKAAALGDQSVVKYLNNNESGAWCRNMR